MTRGFRGKGMLLIGVALVLASCATTVLTNVWKDDKFTGQIRKAFVIGAFKEVNARQFMEDELVAQLKSRGVDAVSSYSYFNYGELAVRKNVASKAREVGADTVIVSRRVAADEVQPYLGGAAYGATGYDDWDVHHARTFAAPAPGAVDVAFVESKLFLTKNEKAIWSARSETVLEGSRREVVSEFVKLVVNQLAADGLIRQGQ